MNSSTALARISEDELRVQTVAEHLQATAKLCGQFAGIFGAEQAGYYPGLLHDIGKYSTAFQCRLQGGPKVDHSTAGSKEAQLRGQPYIAFAVAGHHTGLPDGGTRSDTDAEGTFLGRMKRKVEPCSRWEAEITLPPLPALPLFKQRYELAFYTRMLYSCLVDADYLDTEAFMDDTPSPRGGYAAIPTLLERLNDYIAPWWTPKNDLNTQRCQILRTCLDTGKAG